MTFDKIIKDLRNKVYYPIYFLQGEESYFIDEITKEIQNNILNEQEKELNQTILYGKDTDIKQVINAAKRFPMMANYQVLIVKEAQNLSNFDLLESYAENPLKSTILVFNYKYKKLDGRKKVTKILKKKHLFYESKKLYDNQIPNWISNYIKLKGYKIDSLQTRMLSENLGSNLSTISNELEKLFIDKNKGEEITKEDISDKIGIHRDYNMFELNRALGSKDILKANRIINHFASDLKSYPIQMLIPILFNYFSNIMMIYALKDKSQNSVASALSVHPFFVKEYMEAYNNYPYRKLLRIISYLKEYDSKSKGINNNSTTDGDLMKEIIFKILH